MSGQRGSWFLSLCIAFAGLAACKEQTAPPASVAPEVVIETLSGRTTPLTVDVVAEVKAYREVDIYSRISGQLVKQSFKPGQKIKEGELLFSIDPRAYDEAIIDARAKLAEAESVLARTRQDVARYTLLLPDNAIPRQTYDQAVATEQQNVAVVQARRAGLERARLDRSYAEVRSPISGQIGLQKIEVGALVSAGQTVLATVSTLDPVVAYFSIPEVEYINLAKRTLERRKQNRNDDKNPIELILADGSVYSEAGEMDFADRALNPATSTLTLRAVFPNPSGLLRPGLNTRVRFIRDVSRDALLIPQKAVTELLGKQFVAVVGTGDKVEQRPITTGARLGDLWLVESGLKAGERIVVEGVLKAQPGTVVKPIAAPAAAADRP
jgi:membrane fusion protein (multidrug efflux system)